MTMPFPVIAGDIGGLPERRFRIIPVEQIAFEVENPRIGDQRLVKRSGREKL